jgi:tRNA(adenine34) deaminase
MQETAIDEGVIRPFTLETLQAVTDPDGAARDDRFMRAALDEARKCLDWDDVPVGAVVARGDEFLAGAGNQRERLDDPTAHAEILALREAARRAGSWRLDGCTLYVTLEPCAMCAGAAVLARVPRLVFGAADPKAGFAGSLGDLVRDDRLNHRIDVATGIRRKEASQLLRAFFSARRRQGPPVSGPAGL